MHVDARMVLGLTHCKCFVSAFMPCNLPMQSLHAEQHELEAEDKMRLMLCYLATHPGARMLT